MLHLVSAGVPARRTPLALRPAAHCTHAPHTTHTHTQCVDARGMCLPGVQDGRTLEQYSVLGPLFGVSCTLDIAAMGSPSRRLPDVAQQCFAGAGGRRRHGFAAVPVLLWSGAGSLLVSTCSAWQFALLLFLRWRLPWTPARCRDAFSAAAIVF